MNMNILTMNSIRTEDCSNAFACQSVLSEVEEKHSLRGMSQEWLAGYSTQGIREYPFTVR